MSARAAAVIGTYKGAKAHKVMADFYIGKKKIYHRSGSKTGSLIATIKKAFDDGKTLYSFKTSRPEQDRKRLYAATRVRGLSWRFAILENEVFVTR